MLGEIRFGTDYLVDKAKYDALADKVVYTGTIDSYFDYCFGKLQYRSLRFETEVLDCDNYQGNAVINYTDRETPYTRNTGEDGHHERVPGGVDGGHGAVLPGQRREKSGII